MKECEEWLFYFFSLHAIISHLFPEVLSADTEKLSCPGTVAVGFFEGVDKEFLFGN